MMNKVFLVGRNDSKVDICIKDLSISGVHLELTLIDADKVLITDLKSTNGVFKVVNNQKKKILKDYVFFADTILIGKYKTTVLELIEMIDQEEESRYIRGDDGSIIRG